MQYFTAFTQIKHKLLSGIHNCLGEASLRVHGVKSNKKSFLILSLYGIWSYGHAENYFIFIYLVLKDLISC